MRYTLVVFDAEAELPSAELIRLEDIPLQEVLVQIAKYMQMVNEGRIIDYRVMRHE